MYNTEKEGQIKFFNSYKLYISQIKDKELEDILSNYTDGLFGGNILEFKLRINNTDRVLYQTIKYLSRCRINGIPIPANILLISLNDEKIYKFNSLDFLDKIEILYIGGASKNNDDFSTTIQPEIIDYSGDIGRARLINVLREEKYTKININEDCILGWAKKYYGEMGGSKGDFLSTKNDELSPIDGEIRSPQYLMDFINPYKGKDNERFQYLMDKLNDPKAQKELGAYFTPPLC